MVGVTAGVPDLAAARASLAAPSPAIVVAVQRCRVSPPLTVDVAE